MKDCSRLFVFIMLLVPTVFSAEEATERLLVQAGDPGIIAGSVVSVLVNARAGWGEDRLSLGFEISSIKAGRLRYDSIAWVGKFAGVPDDDLTVIGAPHRSGLIDTLRIESSWHDYRKEKTGEALVLELFFTSLKAGRVNFQVVAPSVTAKAGQPRPPAASAAYTCSPERVTILPPPKQTPPVLSKSGPLICRVGNCVDLEVAAGWPELDKPGTVRVSLLSPDRGWTVSGSSPRFDTIVPATFSWCPGTADIGIWIASFQSSGLAEWSDETTIEIQVVSSDQALVKFDDAVSMIGPVVELTGASARRANYSLPLPVLEAAELSPVVEAAMVGPVALPDRTLGWQGGREAVGGDFNGDAFPDSAFASHEGLIVHWGGPQGLSEDDAQLYEGEVFALGAADLNSDGRDDLVSGTPTGLMVFQHLGEAEFGEIVPGADEGEGAISQAITAICTGYDFDRDQRPDIALATATNAAGFCRVAVYNSTDEGALVMTYSQRLFGQVSDVAAGDLNGDGLVDLVYVNRSQGYVGLIFSQDDNTFSDELRFGTASDHLSTVAVVDYDLDGDLDLLLETSSEQIVFGAQTLLMANQLDPDVHLGNRLEVRARGNVRPRLVAPDGLSLSAGDASIVAGEFHRVALDTLPGADALIKVDVLQRGAYEIVVGPRPNQKAGRPFWLEYSVNGISYSLARGLANREAGYRFVIYPNGNSPVHPAQGEFIESALPTFSWTSAGTDRFELASDINFSHVLETATVTGGLYTLHMMLPSIDSATFYWRVRAEAAPDWDGVYVFNRLKALGDSDQDLENSGLPQGYDLAQNYPNPFNPLTTIEYYLPQGMPVRMTVHNVLGQLIYVLVDRFQSAGQHTVDWRAQDETGSDVASGIYFYRLETGGLSLTRKMVLVR